MFVLFSIWLARKDLLYFRILGGSRYRTGIGKGNYPRLACEWPALKKESGQYHWVMGSCVAGDAAKESTMQAAIAEDTWKTPCPGGTVKRRLRTTLN